MCTCRAEGTGDLEDWTIGAVHGNPPCEISSGMLPSTGKAPELWENAEPVVGPATREGSVEWACCRTENKGRFRPDSHVQASADPLKETIQGAWRVMK